MSSIKECRINNPAGDEDVCAQFNIDIDEMVFILGLLPLIEGEEYTLNFWARSEDKGKVSAYGKELKTDGEWQRFSSVFTADSNEVLLSFGLPGTYYIYNTMLENGNIPSDWSPSPEDQEEEFGRTKLSIDAITEFVNSAKSGDKTVIDGGSINLKSLFAREITIETDREDGGQINYIHLLKDEEGAIYGRRVISIMPYGIRCLYYPEDTWQNCEGTITSNFAEYGCSIDEDGICFWEKGKKKSYYNVNNAYVNGTFEARGQAVFRGAGKYVDSGDGAIPNILALRSEGILCKLEPGELLTELGLASVPSAIQLYKTADEEGYSTTYNGFCPFNKDVETYSVAYGNLALDTEVVNYHDREAQTVYGVRAGSGITAVRVNASVSFKNNDTANPRAGYIRICRYRPETGVLSIYCLSRFNLPAVDPSRATASASALVTVQENDFIFISAYKNNAAADIDVITGDHGTTMFVEAIH